jgi:hypothetical protein
MTTSLASIKTLCTVILGAEYNTTTTITNLPIQDWPELIEAFGGILSFEEVDLPFPYLQLDIRLRNGSVRVRTTDITKIVDDAVQAEYLPRPHYFQPGQKPQLIDGKFLKP